MPLPLPNDGLRAVNTYVIETEAGLALIDSGWALPASEKALSTALASINYGLSDIKKFFITHMHADHYTQALALRSTYGAEVYLGIGEKESLAFIQQRNTNPGPSTHFRTLVSAGAEELARESELHRLFESSGGIDWSDPDQWLTSNEVFDVGGRNIRVLATPGHTQGHVVFHDEVANLLFAGDHVLPSITPSIGFEPIRSNTALGSYLDSLTKLLILDDCVLLPAHGTPGASVHARVRELLSHHDQRLGDMKDSIRTSPCTALDVAQRVTWTSRHRAFSELNLFNQVLAVLETDSHLQLLTARGLLDCVQKHEVDYFSHPAHEPVTLPQSSLDGEN